MSTTFREAIRGVRTELTKALDVSNLLLGDLQDRKLLTDEQYYEIRVRCFFLCLMLTVTRLLFLRGV